MLTMKRILEILKREGVDMAKNPRRNFLYYHQGGFLPKPRKHPHSRELVFPEHTVEVLRAIRKYRAQHKGLQEIRILTAHIREPDLLKNKQELFENPESHREEIRKEVIRILNLEEDRKFKAWLVFPKDGTHYVMVHIPPNVIKLHLASADTQISKETLTTEKALLDHNIGTRMVFI